MCLKLSNKYEKKAKDTKDVLTLVLNIYRQDLKAAAKLKVH